MRAALTPSRLPSCPAAFGGVAHLLLMAMVVASCRTSDEGRRAGSEVVQPKAIKGEAFVDEIKDPPAEVKGFDLTGAVSCLPLEKGRECIARKDALADACASKQGSVQRCEDCRTVCDKPVAN